MEPFIKWVGGKRKLIATISKHLPKTFEIYYEPFLGGGALFLHLQPTIARLGDSNRDLIECYKTLAQNPEQVIQKLESFQTTEYVYYRIRDLDRHPDFKYLNEIEKTARFIYLTKNCFKGLYRVNSKGQFNSPYGNYKSINYDFENMREVAAFLNQNNGSLKFSDVDFVECVESAKQDDFVYLDPPYHAIKSTSFTGYTAQKFLEIDQQRVFKCIQDLTNRGCKVMLSNSASPFIQELYQDFKIIPIYAYRAMDLKHINEVLILNY